MKKKMLKDLSFNHAGAHVAVVGDIVGGAASGQNYTLMFKSQNNYSKQTLEKASMIKVTLTIEDYLEKFFHMYEEDAIVLAQALGFTTQFQDEMVAAEQNSTVDSCCQSYKDYIDGRVASIEVMKSMKNKGLVATLSTLDEKDYLQLLQDQEFVERSFSKIDKAKESGATAPDTQQNASVENKVEPSGSVIKSTKKDKMQEIEIMQKSLDEGKVELAKALELVELFKQEKKEAVTKARKEKLDAVVKNKEQSEVLFKALGLLQADVEFDEVLKTLSQMQSLAEKSELFKSVGVDGDVEQEVEVSYADKLKIAATAKYAKK